MTHRWRQFWPYLLLTLTYLPSTYYSFAHHDQYRYFRVPPAEKTGCAEDTQFYGLLFDLGRPVAAFIECLQFKTVNELPDLTWSRLITLILIFALAHALQTVFHRRWGFSREASGLLAVLICVLPGLLNLFIMANEAVVIALILGALAFLAFDSRPTRLALAFSLFTIALFTYPAAAFLMIGLAFANALFTTETPGAALKRLLFTNLVALLGSIIFFSTVKFVLHPYSDYDLRHPTGDGWGGATYAFRLSTDFLGRLRFFGQAMNASLNFWNIYVTSVLSLAVLGLMLAMVARRFRTSQDPGFKWKASVAAAGFLATFAPLLVAGIQEILFRTLVATSAYALLVLVWLTAGQRKIHVALITTLAILVPSISGFHLFMTARNSALEIGYLANQIRERGLLQEKILLIKNVGRSQATTGINGLPSVTDEFNVNSTVYEVHELNWIMRVALIQAGAPADTQVYSCADAADCLKAEISLLAKPNIRVISRGLDFSGYPARYPVIDLESFSR